MNRKLQAIFYLMTILPSGWLQSEAIYKLYYSMDQTQTPEKPEIVKMAP